MFLDEAVIEVIAGSGGRGCVSFRREKYMPNGGPDGGDGGRGGDIVFLADDNTDTLSDYVSRKKFEAPKGGYGMGSNRHGKDGEDRILLVPPGTTIREILPEGSKDEPLNVDLMRRGDRLVVGRGGRGGYGNGHFATATRQAPDFAELGEPGERRTIKLELKLVADVGLVGYPNVGKSTLISVISAAKPKIADYAFTTLVPNLGVAKVDTRTYVVCDVPGLIEGASEGKGLGDAFLKHIERCGVIVHMLDVSRALQGTDVDPGILEQDYKTIRNELTAYSPALAAKNEIIVVNKIDLIPGKEQQLLKDLEKRGMTIFDAISAATRQGTEELKKKLLPIVLKFREERDAEPETTEPAPLPVLRPHLATHKMGAYRVEKTETGIVVRGKRLEQFTTMTDFSNQSAVKRFIDVIERIGLKKAIKKARTNDEPVFIGSVRVEEYL